MPSSTFLLKVGTLLLLIQNTVPRETDLSVLYPDIESYRLDGFPPDKVALHMPCEESNMFATNCACHIKCKESTCRQAWEICEKYKTSKGCKYVLLRGQPNKIATLKRVPTQAELDRFSIAKYPKSMQEGGFNSSNSDILNGHNNINNKYKKIEGTNIEGNNIKKKTDRQISMKSEMKSEMKSDMKSDMKSEIKSEMKAPSNIWQAMSDNQGGGKNGKILSDLVAVGGPMTKRAVQALYEKKVSNKLCEGSSSSSINNKGDMSINDNNADLSINTINNAINNVNINMNSNSNDIIKRNTINSDINSIGGVNSSSSNMNGNSIFPVRNEKEFLSQGIALVCLNYRTPMTLINTLRTWNASGLLQLVTERVMILNDPYASEIAMALEHGFRVVQPKTLDPDLMVKPNVLTIGAAFSSALKEVKSEYVLFLENDFKMDLDLKKDEIISQLVSAAGLLNKGAEVIRLLSRKGQGCGTFKPCDHHGIHLNAKNPMERTRNWYSYYCKTPQDSPASIADCLDTGGMLPTRAFRCFTSWDSNWSLHAVMVKKSTMLHKKYLTANGRFSIADIGLQSKDRQDGFETSMIQSHKWMKWRVPICIAYQGLFLHEEIETAS